MSKYDVVKAYDNDINNNDVFQFVKYQIIQEGSFKYLIFVVKNNFNEELREVEFVVEETFDNKTLKKSIFNLKKLQVPENKKYVPALKIPLNDQTTDVILTPVKITYSKSVFEDEFINEEIEKEVEHTSSIRRITKNSNIGLPIFLFLASMLIFLFTLINANKYINAHNLSRNNTFEYVRVLDGIAITSYKGISPNVVIPETYDGFTVVGINEGAFINSKIQSVNILADNIYIEYNAFYRSTELKTVVGKNISYIANQAFMYNTKLSSVEFNSVNYIHDYAFQDANNLKSLKLDNIEETKFSYNSMSGTNIENIYYWDNYLIIDNTLVSISNGSYLNVTENTEFNKISKNLYNSETISSISIEKRDFILNKETIGIFTNLIELEVGREIQLQSDIFYLLSPTVRVLKIPSISINFVTYFNPIGNYYFDYVFVEPGDKARYFSNTEPFIGSVIEDY